MCISCWASFRCETRTLGPNGDPAGQCLAAMLVGQALSGDVAFPVYGCYIIGDLWRFITLTEREYAISPGYSATSDDLSDIFRVLKALRQIVAGRVAGVVS